MRHESATDPTSKIPADALIAKDDQTLVGVVTKENKVNSRPVIVLENDGKVVRLSKGVEVGERVVLNPGFETGEEVQVQPVETKF